MNVLTARIVFLPLFYLMIFMFVIPAQAQNRTTKTIEADFEDVFFDLQEQIIGRGLVVEHIGHVGKMLDRTAEAVTGNASADNKVYKYAKYLQFCSASLTHEAANANPANLSICPFVLYAYETTAEEGKTIIGYRNPDFGNTPSTDPLVRKVHQFLNKIIEDIAAEFE